MSQRTKGTKQINIRVPLALWDRLKAAAGLLGQTQSSLVSAALTQYFTDLPAATRRLIDDALTLRRKP